MLLEPKKHGFRQQAPVAADGIFNFENAPRRPPRGLSGPPPESLPPQVPPQHLGDAIFEAGQELALTRQKQRQYFRAACKRKMGGGHPDEAAPPPRKRRRVKTFVTVMQIDNCLRTSSDLRLCDFIVPKTAEGKYAGDPFLWPSLSLATDSGPDCVCLLAVPLAKGGG